MDSNRNVVLVVEDDLDIQEALIEVFSLENINAKFFTSGDEALRYLKTLENDPLPVLILLDLMMPGTDGQGFRNEQMKNPLIAGIPTVLMSAHGQSSTLVAKLGFQGYLKKPIRIADLLATVKHFMPPSEA